MANREVWSRKQTVLAMDLYCRIPFGQCTQRNSKVKELAKVIGRSPGAVARKLGNLARFDPALAARGVTGLVHGSKMDEEVWADAHEDWNQFVEEAEALLKDFNFIPPKVPDFDIDLENMVTEKEGSRLLRLGQDFFRSMVLSSYRRGCSVCLLDEPRLLVAGHIRPWADDPRNRLNPRNGICLCSIHDRAFDQGLLVLDERQRWRTLPPLAERLAKEPYDQFFGRFEGREMAMPERWLPDMALIEWHRVRSMKGV